MLLLLSLMVAASDAPATPAVDNDPTVCKNITRTGSRLPPQKVCKPASEWQVMSNRARNDIADIQRRAAPESLPVF